MFISSIFAILLVNLAEYVQGSKGIRHWYKLIYIPNDDTPNYPFCSLELGVKILDTKLIEPTNQNPIKIPKVVKPTNKKTLL